MAEDTKDFKVISNNYDSKKNSIVALGLFDGVHLGHKKIIDYAIDNKGDNNALIFTFTTKNDRPQKKIAQKDIFTTSVKLDILSEFEIDGIYMPDFDEIKSIAPYDFIKTVLHEKLKAKVLCCGEDFKFGNKARGNVQYLKEVCSDFGIEVRITKPLLYDDNNKVSSTEIRNALLNGDIEFANKLLGFDYFVFEEVVKGKQLGRTIDCPTINQRFSPDVVVPKYGVYISAAILDGVEYPSITNIGVKPTVDSDGAPLSETHIIGIDRNLYGKKIKTKLKKFIREEQKFSDLTELSNSIKMAIDISKIYFKLD